MGNKAFKLILLLSHLAYFTFGQEKKKEISDIKTDNIIEQKVENIAEQSDNSTIDYSQLVEDLQYFSQNPLNLNNATEEDLRKLGLLSDIQINSFLRHREKNGDLISIYELQSISLIELDDIQRILPYVTVKEKIDQTKLSLQGVLMDGRHSITSRVQFVAEPQKGFTNPGDSVLAINPDAMYLGSRYAGFFRYRFQYSNKISLSLTGDKDYGEEFFKGSQKNGFDFYSGHFYLKDWGKLKALALGDYQAQFGQGLTFWTGLAYGKTSDPLMLKRSARGISASNSFNESLFLRGAAASVLIQKFTISGFYSINRLDANLSADTLDNTPELISSIQVAGLHNTASSVANKNNIKRECIGTNINWHKRNLSIGITLSGFRFDKEIKTLQGVYNQFYFSGSKTGFGGIDYNYIWRNFNFYGESSAGLNRSLAHIHGCIVTLDPKLYATVLYRNYSIDYNNLFSAGIGENTRNQNEQGILTGLVFKPVAKFSIATYFDRYQRPFVYYQINKPSLGQDFFGQISFIPGKKTEMYLRYRSRIKARNNGDWEGPMDQVMDSKQQNIRYSIVYNFNRNIRLRTRIDQVLYTYNGVTRSGNMIYQDVQFNSMQYPVSFNLRYGLFDVEDYYARVYTYENDVPLSFSIPAFDGKGSRFYITLDYIVSKHLEIWLRYSQTWYSNTSVISEGTLNEIQGNTRSDIKLQARYKF